MAKKRINGPMGRRSTMLGDMCACSHAARIRGEFRLPVAVENRAFRGDLDIRVDGRGVWLYNQNPLSDDDASLLAGYLKRDADGFYWLVTPTEMGRISVEDAPLLAVEACSFGSGCRCRLSLLLNTGQVVTVTRNTPLIQRADAAANTAAYVIDADGIEARLTDGAVDGLRSGLPRPCQNGVWSDGCYFPLDTIPHNIFLGRRHRLDA